MITYIIDDSVYINLTNKCSNSCYFCVRATSNHYDEYNLWLDKEPTEIEVINDLKQYLKEYDKYVFCGYGEPTEKLDILIKVAKFLKENNKNVRLNTNGQSDLINGEKSYLKLLNAVDIVSVSLNNYDAKSYNQICHSEYGDKAFQAILDFAVGCKNAGIETHFSMVKCENADVGKTQKLADSLKIQLRVRDLIV
ncbi:MAG: TatD family nuclease-associated radical SAM protein [Clostridia bacterium]|nr:TatD family nuclease-associated radical SAM protein [Clostridia bacterium]